MVEGIIEEKYANRSGLLSRLFTWSPEEDTEERHIQMAPINPAMWADFQKAARRLEEGKASASPSGDAAEKVTGEVSHAGSAGSADNADNADNAGSAGSEGDEDSEESEDSETSETSEEGAASPYEMTAHEATSIEAMLECVDKCRLDLLFASSQEWANTTLLTFIGAAVRLAESPYRSGERRGQA